MIYNKNITLGFRKCPPPQPWMDTLEYIIILEQFFFLSLAISAPVEAAKLIAMNWKLVKIKFDDSNFRIAAR